MKKFLTNCILFFVVTLIMLGLFMLVWNKIINEKSNFSIGDGKTILILGNSHAECALDDGLIDNSINLANSAESYFYTYLKLRRILKKNNNIKQVFLEFDYGAFSSDSDRWLWSSGKYNRYSTLISLDDIKNLFLIHPVDTVKMIAMEGFLSVGIKGNSIAKWGGYLHLERDKLSESIERVGGVRKNVDYIEYISPINLRYLQKIVDICEENNARLIFIRNPIHSVAKIHDKTLEEIKIKHFKDIDFIDLASFSLKNDEYGDISHLNHRGAKTFSLFFNKLLNEGLLTATDKQEFVNQEMQKR